MGIDVDSLHAYNFKVPLKFDVRCPSCRMFWTIIIRDIYSPIEFVVQKKEKIDMVKPESIFGLQTVSGRRICPWRVAKEN